MDISSDDASLTDVARCVAETVDADCARVRCHLPAGHSGLHDDGNGARWRSPNEDSR